MAHNSFIDAAIAATAQQQKYTPYRARRDATLWLDADSLSVGSQFWYDESEYHAYSGETYLWLPGKTGSYVWQPASANHDVSTDIEFMGKLELASWVPAYDIWIVNRRGSGGAGYGFRILNSGSLQLVWHDGNATINAQSTVVLPFAANTAWWVRGTLDVDNGSGGWSANFYYSSDGTNWTQLGSTVTGPGATSIPSASSTSLAVGAWYNGGLAALQGKIYRAVVKNGINGPAVADFNPATYLENGWTLSGQDNNGEYPAIVAGSKVPRYRAIFGSSAIVDAADPIPLILGEPAAIYCNGDATKYLMKPRANVGLNLGQDFEVTARITLDDWAATAQGSIISMYQVVGNARSWTVRVDANKITIIASSDGTVTASHASTSMDSLLKVVNGEYLDIRCRFSKINGVIVIATQAKQPNDPVWTDLGRTVTTLPSLCNTSADMVVGAGSLSGASANEPHRGKIAWVKVVQSGTVTDEFNAENITGWTNVGSVITMPAQRMPYAFFPGSSGNVVSTPHASALNLTTSVELVARARLKDWTPDYNSYGVVGKGEQYSLQLSTARQTMQVTIAGQLHHATAPTGMIDNRTYWIKATWRSSDGRIQFFVAPDSETEPSTWTQIGANVTGPSTPLSGDTSNLRIGSITYSATEYPMVGKVYRAIVRDGPGGAVVASFNPASMAAWSVACSASGYHTNIVTRNTLMFDGDDDVVTMPDRPSIRATSDSTFATFGKLGAQSRTYPRIISKESSNNDGYYLLYYTAGASAGAFMGDGTNNITGLQPFDVSAVKPFALSGIFDNTAKEFTTYINGATHIRSVAAVTNYNQTANMKVGSASFGSQHASQLSVYGVMFSPNKLSLFDMKSVAQKYVPEAYA